MLFRLHTALLGSSGEPAAFSQKSGRAVRRFKPCHNPVTPPQGDFRIVFVCFHTNTITLYSSNNRLSIIFVKIRPHIHNFRKNAGLPTCGGFFRRSLPAIRVAGRGRGDCLYIPIRHIWLSSRKNNSLSGQPSFDCFLGLVSIYDVETEYPIDV